MKTPRARVLDRIFRLQQAAWSGIDDGRPGTLPGKRIAEDEKGLRSCIDDLGRFSDHIERAVRHAKVSDRRDHVYSVLNIFMRAAEFIGSRVRPSLSQRNYHAAMQGSAAGRRSAAKAAEASRRWQEHVEELALKLRRQKPKLSRERLATEILEKWAKPGVSAPAHRTVREHIVRLEKSGSLPGRTKNGPPTG
jgi:hypothetical protein